MTELTPGTLEILEKLAAGERSPSIMDLDGVRAVCGQCLYFWRIGQAEEHQDRCLMRGNTGADSG